MRINRNLLLIPRHEERVNILCHLNILCHVIIWLVRDANGTQISLVSRGIIGNNVIGIKVPNVRAARSFQDRVDAHPRYKNLSIPYGNGSIKNSDGNHTIMPFILEKNNLITW